MDVLRYFASLRIDESWTYEDLKRKEINYLTHSYHRYPAKFIPQLARRLIEQYSGAREVVCDPFVGSGTTLVEGLVTKRRVMGVDINPIAYLISKAKITYINPRSLERTVSEVFAKIDSASAYDRNVVMKEIESSPSYEKIRYWFDLRTIKELSLILSIIKDVGSREVQLFLRCGFSHILKNCSYWSMRSIKPIRETHKKVPKAVPTFQHHIKHMVRKNSQFYAALPNEVKKNVKKYAQVFCGDCRNVPCSKHAVSLIITSPPYVTSYEYVDLHQLSILWLRPSSQIVELRKKSIGTAQSKNVSVNKIRSEVGNSIIEELKTRGHNGYARSVFTYFAEMQQSLEDFQRVLKPGGIGCFIVGDTTLGEVDILNAEVLTEIALDSGYQLKNVIKRRVPNNGKFLPSMRDPRTGSFALKNSRRNKLAYPYEFILVLFKSHD